MNPEAAVIDPGGDLPIDHLLGQRHLKQIWITHAHLVAGASRARGAEGCHVGPHPMISS